MSTAEHTPPTRDERALARAWQRFGFPLRFAAWLAAFAWLGQTEWFREGFRLPLGRAIAWSAGIALDAVGIETRVNGDLVTAGGFSAVVHTDCDGIVLLGLFLAAVLAFPVRSRLQTLPATLLGVLALVVLNWLRVVALIVTGYLDPELFEMTHVYAWQAALMAGTMVVWILWANHVLRRER